MFTTPEELQEFKQKIRKLLADESKPITINDVCTKFRSKYDVDFKKWFKCAHKGIPKALPLFQNYLTDVAELDFKTNAPEILVVYKRNGNSSTKMKKKPEKQFQEHLKHVSRSDCEERLKSSLKSIQGSSKNHPIQIGGDDGGAAAATSSEFFEFNYKEQTFPYVQEFKTIKSDVTKFNQYRDYQMVHIAYVKLRLATLFYHTGKSKMHFYTICALFRQLFNESFFQNNILKHYVTSGPDRDSNIITFLKRFCGDFIFINEQKEASVSKSMSSLITKFHSSLVKAVEKLQQQQQDQQQQQRQQQPQQPQHMIMGKVAADNIVVDVRRSTEHVRFGGGPSNTNVGHNFLDFPGLVREDFTIARPTISEVNERANEIRNRICQQHRAVKTTEVIHELCASFNVACIKDIRPLECREIRKETDVPALEKLMKLQGKVNAFAQSFSTFRNICTLHELEEELCKMEATQCFDDLKLGPLQKQLIVYDLFQFPSERPDIPPITTYDIFRLLWKCYDEKYKSQKKILKLPDGSSVAARDLHVKILLPEFMEYVKQTYGFKTAEESGLRINNVGHALQATRKAWFSDLHNVKKVTQKFKDQLNEDFLQQLEFAKKKTLGAALSSGPEIIDSDSDDDAETLHQKIGNIPLLEAFDVTYNLLQELKREACKTLPTTAYIVNFSDITMNALTVIHKDKFMSDLFHTLLSIAPLKALGKDDVKILKYLGFSKALNTVQENASTVEQHSSKNDNNDDEKKVVPKSHVMSAAKKWLSNSSNIDLKCLANVESQITAELKPEATVFDRLGHGSFLKFITAEESLNTILEFGFSTPFEMRGSKATKEELIHFVKQCGEGRSIDDLEISIELQYNIKCSSVDIRHLQQKASESKNKTNSIISFQHAFLCASEFHQDTNKESPRNKQRLTQLACRRIEEAPLLVDLQQSINWNIMFQAKIGSFKNFLNTSFHNAKNPKNCSFHFLELSDGRCIKILKHCTLDDFRKSLNALDPTRTSSCIVTLLLSSLNILDAPLSLLANHMQNVLMETVGRNLQPNSEVVQRILKFTIECFQLIPFEILCCVARKLFIIRLGAVLGTQKVPNLLLQTAKKNNNQRRILHGIGFYLSINEWMKDAEEYVDDSVCVNIEKKSAKDSPESVEMQSREDVSEEEVGDPNSTACKGEHEEKVTSDKLLTVETIQHKTTDIKTNVSDSIPKEVEKCDRVESCKKEFIENIRHYEFGVGMEIGAKEQRLLDIHREREGRSLHRLSRELYTKDSHFVLELVQNADDNEYPVWMTKQESIEKPAVAFVLEEEKIIILNNEKGFEEKNIRALCDIGKSTKGLHRKGYIGQKGIGFKSVFRVTEKPEIHSNGFHIKFDASCGPNGYILPQWIDTGAPALPDDFNKKHGLSSWMTKIVLPLKKEMQHAKLTSRFHDIHPSLLLFLNRLHTVVIDDKVAGTVKVMSKEIIDKNMVKLTENENSSLWFVVTKEIPVQLHGEVKHTDISIAFPLVKEKSEKQEMLPFQPIFAYLPLRSYGFKFIIQADFDVPSSREDLDVDSAWNQCILHYIPQLVAEAFIQFKESSHFVGFRGIIEYFKFLDMEDHVLGTFKQVARNIITCLQREQCLPTDHGDNSVQKWSLPTALVYGCDLLRSAIPLEMLSKYLGLNFVHKEIQSEIPWHVLEALGVSQLSIEQLTEIAKAVFIDFKVNSSGACTEVNKKSELVHWIGKWFVALYKRLHDTCDYSEHTMALLRALKIFPLCDGSFVSLEEDVVFFPVDNNSVTRKVQDPLNEIEKDLKILTRDVYSNLDQIQQEQVRRLLKDVGVKSMTPSDLISNHIIPLFKEGQWENKPEALLVSSVCYLRQKLATDNELIDMGQLKEDVVLKTNKGFKRIRDHQIYLPCEYGNSLNLPKMFPACEWTLVSAQYISGHSSIERRAWHDFFITLGLHTFISPHKKILELHRSDMPNSPWKDLSLKWPQADGMMYTIEDIALPEFDNLIVSKDEAQIETFAITLNDMWKKRYEKYDFGKACCDVKDKHGNVIAMTYCSLYLKMREAKWIPSSDEDKELFVPRDLYQMTNAVEQVFAKTVNYISPKIRDPDFIAVLGVENKVKVPKFVEIFRKWSSEKVFSTNRAHVFSIYEYIRDVITPDSDEFKDLMKNKCIFLPNQENRQQTPTNKATITGRFYKIKEVCWEDPSNVVEMSQDVYGTRRILKGYYPDAMYGFFVNRLHVPLYPTTAEYLNTVFNLVNRTVLPDKEASCQLYTTFHVLGQKTVLKEKFNEFKTWGVPKDPEGIRSLYHSMEAFIDPEMVKVLYFGRNSKNRLLPSHTRQFKSIDDRPILCVDDNVRHIYEKGENIEIVSLSDISDVFRVTNECAAHLRCAREREMENIVLFTMLFYRACGLELISDLQRDPEILATQECIGCYFWEVLLCNITPAIQRFIARMFPSHYNKMKMENFYGMLQSCIEFKTVRDLNVTYTLKGRENVKVKRSKLCTVQHLEDDDNMRKCIVYISEAFSGGQQFGEQIIKELMGIFVGNDDEKKELLKEFVLTYTTVVNKEAFLRRKQIPKLNAGENQWEYPLPKHSPDSETATAQDRDSLKNSSSNGPEALVEITDDTTEDKSINQPEREVSNSKNREPPRKKVKGCTANTAKTTTTSDGNTTDVNHTSHKIVDLTNIDHTPIDLDKVDVDTPPQQNCNIESRSGKRKNDVLSNDEKASAQDVTARNSNVNDSNAAPSHKKMSEWFLDYHNALQHHMINSPQPQGLRRHHPKITPRVDVTDQYEDVAMEINKVIDGSHISVERMLKSKDPDGQIGKLGESIVYQHLCEEYNDELINGLVQIEWLNEDRECWLPYDMKLTFYDQRQPPIVYVEVKATYLDEKKEFEISSHQIKFAFEQGARYHLYRLSGLRNVEELKLRRLPNLGMYLENKSVKLFMIL